MYAIHVQFDEPNVYPYRYVTAQSRQEYYRMLEIFLDPLIKPRIVLLTGWHNTARYSKIMFMFDRDAGIIENYDRMDA